VPNHLQTLPPVEHPRLGRGGAAPRPAATPSVCLCDDDSPSRQMPSGTAPRGPWGPGRAGGPRSRRDGARRPHCAAVGTVATRHSPEGTPLLEHGAWSWLAMLWSSCLMSCIFALPRAKARTRERRGSCWQVREAVVCCAQKSCHKCAIPPKTQRTTPSKHQAPQRYHRVC
jgi:hypothetical protein